MKFLDHIHLQKPTSYDVTMTILLIIIFILVCCITCSQKEVTREMIAVRHIQNEMQKNQITKDYLFEFYITRNQILYIEQERNRAFDYVRNGADPVVEEAIFLKRVDELFKLRDRGQ